MTKFPLSSFRVAGNLLFISGQIGQKDGTLVSEDLEEQVIQTITNIKDILVQNGSSLKSILDITAFIVGQDDYATFNEVYRNNLEEPYPARTTVVVKSLPLGAKVELKAIAAKD